MDLKLKYRLFMQVYPYRHIDWRPGTRLSRLLAQSRIALLTSAGLFTPEQQPFDASIRGGDWSFCEIPPGTPIPCLRIGQKSDAFDHSGIEADRNLALPLDRLQELVQAGEVGEAPPRHFSIMVDYRAWPLDLRNRARIARRLLHDKAGAVFLIPV